MRSEVELAEENALMKFEAFKEDEELHHLYFG
jgi:hypothetical protein